MKYTKQIIFLFLLLSLIILSSCLLPVFAIKSESNSSPETIIKDQVVWIGNVPFFVKDARDAQAKADQLYKLLMEMQMETQAGANAQRATISKMIQDGYVTIEHRGSNTPVASTVINTELKLNNVDIFGPAIAGDARTAAFSAITESVANTTDKADSLQEIDQAILDRIAEKLDISDDILTSADVVSKGLAYVEAYNDFMKNGGKSVDQFGVLNEKYVKAMRAQTDYIASYLPSYYGPVADAINDAGASVAAIQAGDLPSSAAGKVVYNVASIISSVKPDDFKNPASGIALPPAILSPPPPPCWGKSAPGCVKKGIITTKCPLTFVVTSPDGKKAGVDPVTNKVLEEIPGSFVIAPEKYSVDPQIVYLPKLESGEYSIELNGRGNGDYNLFYKTYDMENNVLTTQKLKGRIHSGEVLSAKFNPKAESLTRDSEKIIFSKNIIYNYVLPTIGFVFIALVVSFLVIKKKRRYK
jgi:hypothetical protein